MVEITPQQMLIVARAATASCFQIGWSADERVGETIAQMHAPVPDWEKEIGYAVNKYITPRSITIGLPQHQILDVLTIALI